MDITEFLTACLNEDKRQAMIQPPWPWVLDPADGRTVLAGGGIKVAETYATHRQANVAAYITDHDPARVLREVAAKRKLIELHAPQDVEYVDGDGQSRNSLECITCDNGGTSNTWPCDTAKLLAAPYADRPGFKKAWKPAEAEPAFDPKEYWATLRRREQERRDPAAKDRHADMWKTPEEGGEG